MKFLKVIRYIFYLILIFLVFFLIDFYAYYKYKYPIFSDIHSVFYKLYPKDIILKTGGLLKLPPQRFQHFLNFPFKKEKRNYSYRNFR